MMKDSGRETGGHDLGLRSMAIFSMNGVQPLVPLPEDWLIVIYCRIIHLSPEQNIKL
jgi:hypothetical protein